MILYRLRSSSNTKYKQNSSTFSELDSRNKLKILIFFPLYFINFSYKLYKLNKYLEYIY
jgi:hypothetical protein